MFRASAWLPGHITPLSAPGEPQASVDLASLGVVLAKDVGQ